MNIFKSIYQFFKKLHTQYHTTKQQKRLQLLSNLSCELINVTEFNGRLYISYNNVPMIRVDDLKVKVPELLAQAREDYLAWKAKFNA